MQDSEPFEASLLFLSGPLFKSLVLVLVVCTQEGLQLCLPLRGAMSQNSFEKGHTMVERNIFRCRVRYFDVFKGIVTVWLQFLCRLVKSQKNSFVLH